MNSRTALAAAAISVLALSTAGCGSSSNYGGSGGSGSTGGGTGGSGGSVTGGTGGGTTGGDGGGHVSQPANAGNYSCEFKFDPIQAGASVKGTIWTKCGTAPKRHNLNLTLQRFYNGYWNDVAGPKNNTSIPAPVALPMLITASCVPGHWRMVVSIDGTSATGLDWNIDRQPSPIKEIHPSDCG